MAIFLVALVVGGIWLWRSWPHGQGPLENLPPEVGAKVAGYNDVKSPTSGRLYRVISWGPNAADETYHVAEFKGSPNYVRYWQKRATGARRYHSAYVGSETDPGRQAAVVTQMRSDFGL